MIRLLAPAKINIGLRVPGKRNDGYHWIVTLMQAISLYDEIAFASADRYELHCSGEWQVPEDESNLVTKAVRAFEHLTGIVAKVRIDVTKRIPLGGGLGGGSSDAVAALIGCNNFFQTNLQESDLLALATGIGSDCPFFLRGGIQEATGRGEILTPLKAMLPGVFGLWFPGVSVNTGVAYARLNRNLTQESPSLILSSCLRSENDWRSDPQLKNDFEPVVANELAYWDDAREFWMSCGAKWVSMSGSGSCQVAHFDVMKVCAAAVLQFPFGGRTWAVEPIPQGVVYLNDSGAL
ncbi:MAG: 4-(cytidine 5'-diphospho)-2-C-methyl-D-erythritol kinase [bacterium]|nr:4-(cytidine 5'-diphospho)-2-C-methyl-D-erythritol kinase [bacterium]